jgi:GNAT superfamily N-acetyltransferase
MADEEGSMSLVCGDYRIDDLHPADSRLCEKMTFPAYRHLLALQPAFRLPGEAEQRLVQALGFVGRSGDHAVGLALAEAPVRKEEGASELLSLFVEREHRGAGLATALVEAVEDGLRQRGFPSVEAVYMTGKASIAAVERIFAKRGWETPELRTVTVKFTMQEALATPWYGRMRLLLASAEVFCWKDLTADERRRLVESNERAPWIPKGLEPWRHDIIGFEPVSSLGLRYRGEVVGWVINHQVDARTVRLTCSFMRKELSPRIVPLYSEVLRRLSEAGCEFCTFITPTVYPGMLEFIQRHCAPYASFTGETRGTRKLLTTGQV